MYIYIYYCIADPTHSCNAGEAVLEMGERRILLDRIKVSSSTPVSVARSRSERECVVYWCLFQ